MNNLVATWGRPEEVDLGPEADVCELLARVHDRLLEIPELDEARCRVETVLGQVLAWLDHGVVSLPVRG